MQHKRQLKLQHIVDLLSSISVIAFIVASGFSMLAMNCAVGLRAS